MRQAAQTRRGTIGAILFALINATALAGPAGSDAEFARAATATVERIEREDGFSGVILVARGDQVLLRKAAGFSDRERNVRNTSDTQFPILSITKQFTAAAIMLLVEDGTVALDDSITKYYPATPPAWKDITIKHLLTHSSGIGDRWATDANVVETLRYLRANGDVVSLVSADPLLFTPGSGFQYSNAGYMLLAGVIERASGENYRSFLRNDILAPLEMRNTGFDLRPPLTGYVRSSAGIVETAQVFDEPGGPAGAGSIYSTLDDMLLWSRAWDEGRILSSSSREAALADYGYNYGFGWRFSPKFGRKLVWHTGAFGPGGFASVFDRFPEEKLAFIVMANATGPTGSTATLVIEGKEITFPANAARKVIEEVERLYFGRAP
jgi:CubicO group peptidase (beta-lactamase class C family)